VLEATVEAAMEERFPSVGPDATIEEAVGTLAQSGADALVVEDEDRFLGVVRAEDLLRLEELDVDPADPFFLLTMLFERPAEAIERHVAALTRGRVRGVMRTDAPRLAPDEPLSTAVHLLASGAEALPVVDGEGHVLGVVTRDSVLMHVVARGRAPAGGPEGERGDDASMIGELARALGLPKGGGKGQAGAGRPGAEAAPAKAPRGGPGKGAGRGEASRGAKGAAAEGRARRRTPSIRGARATGAASSPRRKGGR
jgi:CBS domain-containing protein